MHDSVFSHFPFDAASVKSALHDEGICYSLKVSEEDSVKPGTLWHLKDCECIETLHIQKFYQNENLNKTSQELGNCPMGQREALLKERFYWKKGFIEKKALLKEGVFF